MYALVLALLLTTQTQALLLKEQISAVVLKGYPNNIIALSRGLEDGIQFQDHIKLMQGNGFSGRAVCLKTLSKISFWKVYRTTKGAIQNQNQYTLVSIPLSEIKPALLREISSINLDFLKNETQESLLGQSPQEK